MNQVVCQRNTQNVEALFHALSGKSPNFDKVKSLFASDACYWALTPVSRPVDGPEAIVADLKRQLAIGGDLECSPPYAIVASNNHVVLERTDFVTIHQTGHRAGLRICAVFEFDDEGKITAWREYWDQAYCQQQMGLGS